MKILKIRVMNYKSIVDSGDCYLSDGVTILAGKNESGKTSILQAFEDFNSSTQIRPKSRPINKSSTPEITVSFRFTPEEINPILIENGLETEINKSIEIGLTKQYPSTYSFLPETETLLCNLFKNKNDVFTEPKDWGSLKEIYEKYPSLTASNPIPSINFQEDDAFDKLSELNNYIRQNLSVISSIDDQKAIQTYAEHALEEIQLKATKSPIDAMLDSIVKKLIPNFILFDSFDDTFPDEVLFDDLETNTWTNDLGLISNLDVGIVKSDQERDKKNHKQKINVQLNTDYKKFWTQDISQLSIDWNSEKLTFWIEEDGSSYEPSLRSKGRQWHLSFYIKVSARSKENSKNVILIDEPGLYLHATAQEDILRKLESSAKDDKTQLVFSTHSPYLLEADKLNRVRLIIRDKERGTIVENKVHALADKETLTPILTAIGLQLNIGVSDFGKDNNVIVEGPSDVYYLNAFKNIVKPKSDLNFIFGGGSGNMPIVGTILHGWGSKVLYLYDRDQGKKNGEKNLTKNWLVSKDLITSVLEHEGTIEDILDTEDFKKYVLCDEKSKYSSKNSEYVVREKKEKVLLAKSFLELSEDKDNEVELSATSKNNIETLFEKLTKAFGQQ